MPPAARPVLMKRESDDNLDHLDELQQEALKQQRTTASNVTMLDLLLTTAKQTDDALNGDTSVGEDLVQEFQLKRTGFAFVMHPVTDAEMDRCRDLARKRQIDPATGKGMIAEGEYRNRLIYSGTVNDQPGGKKIWDVAAEPLGIPEPMAWKVIEPKVLLVGERDQAFGRLLELSGYRNDAQMVDAAKN